VGHPGWFEEQDLAYDFIDITLSKPIQTLMGNAGGLPINADTSQITDPGTKQFNQLFSNLVLPMELGSILIGLSPVITMTWFQPPRS